MRVRTIAQILGLLLCFGAPLMLLSGCDGAGGKPDEAEKAEETLLEKAEKAEREAEIAKKDAEKALEEADDAQAELDSASEKGDAKAQAVAQEKLRAAEKKEKEAKAKAEQKAEAAEAAREAAEKAAAGAKKSEKSEGGEGKPEKPKAEGKEAMPEEAEGGGEGEAKKAAGAGEKSKHEAKAEPESKKAEPEKPKAGGEGAKKPAEAAKKPAEKTEPKTAEPKPEEPKKADMNEGIINRAAALVESINEVYGQIFDLSNKEDEQGKTVENKVKEITSEKDGISKSFTAKSSISGEDTLAITNTLKKLDDLKDAYKKLEEIRLKALSKYGDAQDILYNMKKPGIGLLSLQMEEGNIDKQYTLVKTMLQQYKDAKSALEDSLPNIISDIAAAKAILAK